MNARLTLFLNGNSILFEKQFGFRHNHSATHTLIEITEKIKQAFDSWQCACGVFLDLKRHLTLSTKTYYSETTTIMV